MPCHYHRRSARPPSNYHTSHFPPSLRRCHLIIDYHSTWYISQYDPCGQFSTLPFLTSHSQIVYPSALTVLLNQSIHHPFQLLLKFIPLLVLRNRTIYQSKFYYHSPSIPPPLLPPLIFHLPPPPPLIFHLPLVPQNTKNKVLKLPSFLLFWYLSLLLSFPLPPPLPRKPPLPSFLLASFSSTRLGG